MPLFTNILESESLALFGELSYEVGNWTFLVGGRYFEDERDAVTLTDLPEATLPIEFGGFELLANRVVGNIEPTQTLGDKFTEFSPKVNVKYEFESGNMAYLNIAEGFRSGFLNIGSLADGVAAVGLNPENFRVIDPDTVLSAELGSKGLLGDSLSYDVALYWTEWDGFVQQVQNGLGAAPIGLLANIGDATITGLEFGLVWNTGVDGLTVTARGNFMDSEVDLDPGFAGSAAFEALQYGSQGDGKISSVSHENFNIAFDYVQPIGDMEMAYNLTAIYRGAQSDAYAIINRVNRAGQTVSADSEDNTLVNISAKLSSDAGWHATLFVRNLFDEIYIQSAFDGRLFGVNPPRQIGLTLGYDF